MIARKSALVIAVQIANGILGYVGLKFIALYMDPWQYGVVGFAFGLVSIFSILGSLGFDQAHVKRVSEGKNLGTCIGTFMVTKMMLAGLVAAVVIVGVGVWKFVVGRGFESAVHEQAVYMMMAYFVLYTLTNSIHGTFYALKETAKTSLPYLSYNLIRVIATVYVAVSGLGAMALAYTYVLGELFHFVISLTLMRNYPVGRPSWSYFKSYQSFAMHVAIAVVAWQIITNVDKVFIQLFWGAQQVGEYFAIFNLSRFILLFAGAVSMLLFPTVSAYHANKDMDSIRRLVLKSERYLSMITTPIIIIMVVLAEPIIRILLSNRYLPAIAILQILPFFVLLEVLSRPYGSQLQGMNMPQIERNRALIMVAVDVGLNFLLIPKDVRSLGIQLAGLGATGAALATVIAYAIGLLYIRYVARRVTGLVGNKTVLSHFFAGAIMGSVVYLLFEWLPLFRWYTLVGVSLAGLGVYLGILRLLSEFTRDDLDLFLDTLNAKKMIAYIRSELKGN